MNWSKSEIDAAIAPKGPPSLDVELSLAPIPHTDFETHLRYWKKRQQSVGNPFCVR